MKNKTFFSVLIISILLLVNTSFAQKDNYVEWNTGDYAVSDLTLKAKLSFDPAKVKKIMFVAPSVDIPYYHVVVPIKRNAGKAPSAGSVEMNSVVPSFWQVYAGGELITTNNFKEHMKDAKNIVILIKYAWANNIEYEIKFKLDEEEQSVNATSPETGGIPVGWKNAWCYLVAEESGIDRISEPVKIDLLVAPDDVQDFEKEVRVMEIVNGEMKEIPSQTYDYQEYLGRGKKSGTTRRPSKSCKVVFLSDIKAGNKKLYLVLWGNPDAEKPEYESDLIVHGEALGAVVENNHMKVKLDDKCGQIVSYELKDGLTPRFENNRTYAAHWNPDTYAETGAWGHSFSWDPPEVVYEVAKGPIIYKVTRHGEMPGVPQVYLSVTYTFYANNPYVLVSTSMEVLQSYGAAAVRNGEMVFNGELFDNFVWLAKNGDIRYIKTLLNPDLGHDAPAIIPSNTPWLALCHSQGKYGMGAIHLTTYNFNPLTGNAATFRPRYFLYCHTDWPTPLTYYVRTLVYPFGYNFHDVPALMIPKGNWYVEESVFMPFAFHNDEEPLLPLELLNQKLREPLEVYYGN